MSILDKKQRRLRDWSERCNEVSLTNLPSQEAYTDAYSLQCTLDTTASETTYELSSAISTYFFHMRENIVPNFSVSPYYQRTRNAKQED